MNSSSKHKYKLMSMLSLCVYYDLYGFNIVESSLKSKSYGQGGALGSPKLLFAK